MLLRLCQLKSLKLFILVLLVSSCSFLNLEREKDASELLTPMKAEWFHHNQRHALYDQLGRPQSHHFFDVHPDLGKTDILINSIILTPEGSVHNFELDLASGQRYYNNSFCPQSDIWQEYNGSISEMTFSVGIIPRMLDQIGEPQKVIIFGGKEKFQKLTDTHQHRIKLVGALIEQSCPEGNCLGRDNWLSKMIFVAVDPDDKKFEKVSNIIELQKIVNWVQTKAVLENINGRNGGAGSSYPAVKVGKLINLKDAIEFYRKRSIFLSDEELNKIKHGCHSLYNKLWTEVGKARPEDQEAHSVEELNTKLKAIEALKKQGLPIGIAARFKSFVKKYFSEFSTCQKIVYAGNINEEKEQFWFLSYVGLFLRLHREGYYYDCRRNTWQKNLINSDGNPIYDIKDEIDECDEKDFDSAMGYLPNYLRTLKDSESEFFKFLDYDNHPFGTHQKLYSWVKVKTKSYDCESDPNLSIRKEIKVFPEDMSWKNWNINDIEDKMKIIY
jgi:hypothetical protein